MRSNNLKTHMKTHENKPQSIDEVTEKIEYHSTLDVVALENVMVGDENEYQRKLELGREVKQLVQELHVPTACLRKEYAEALELFENRGQVKKVKPVEWRPWQYELKEYVNNPTPRRVIWVVGRKGNEGKSLFQDQTEEQYGKHWVCTMPLTETSRNLFGYMQKCVDRTTDIFLFNIMKSGGRRKKINYKLLENIKDGKAKMVLGNSMKRVRFTTPNVIIVFSHEYPDTGKFSEDRWLIFKINAGMGLEDVTVAKIGNKEGKCERE